MSNSTTNIRRFFLALTSIGVFLGAATTAQAGLIATADTVGAGVGEVTLVGGTTSADGVLTFPVEGDKARINGVPGFTGGQPWTIVFWANHTLGPDRDMVGFDADKMTVRTDVWDQGVGTRFRLDAQGGDRFPTTGVTDLTLGTDFHYAVVNDPALGELRLYTNGTLVEALPTTSWALQDTGGIHLGEAPGAGKPGMVGTISGFGLYDEVLPEAAFQGLAAGSRPLEDPDDTIRIFTASPSSIAPGGASQLRWGIATNATAATLQPGSIDALALSDIDGNGSFQVSPDTTTTYTLTVDAPGQPGVTADTTVAVALIGSFSADPDIITNGESSTLIWIVRSDATVAISPDPGGVNTTNGLGSVNVSPSAATEYTLTASAAGETDETATLTVLVLAPPAGARYPAPDGGWDCAYEGDIDPTTIGWSHDNGSDAWDATAPGAAGTVPGGAGVFTESADTFLRLQDTGNPIDHGFPDPTSNRKVYFTKDLAANFSPGASPLTDGVTLYFRSRVATPGGDVPLDDHHPAGGGAITPWTPTGDGYSVHDGGKGNFVIRDATFGGAIAFALATPAGPGQDYTEGDGLTMNRLNGSVASADVDATDASGTPNVLPLTVQSWHDIWVTIEADTSGGGTHRADLYLDTSTTPTSVHLTAGTGSDAGGNVYLAMGLGATPQSGAIDIDFFYAKQGVHVPADGTPFQITQIDYSVGDAAASFSWPSSEGQSFRVERSPDLGASGIWEELDDGFAAAGGGAETTTYVDEVLADTPRMYYRVTRN